jgi:hypothetical protein
LVKALGVIDFVALPNDGQANIFQAGSRPDVGLPEMRGLSIPCGVLTGRVKRFNGSSSEGLSRAPHMNSIFNAGP